MGPGTLYGSIKRMLASKLIEEVSSTDDERRRYYKLTERGKSILSEEINRYNQIIETIKSKKLIGLKLNPFS